MNGAFELARSETAVSAPPPELRQAGSLQYNAASLPFTGRLPVGATANPDGTVTLLLSQPISVPSRDASSRAAEQTVYRELVFRRLIGSHVQGMKADASCARFIMARSLNLSLAALSKLHQAASDCDRLAMAEMIIFLLQVEDGVPARAIPQPDGGFILPLLFPVTDGAITLSSLRFSPLTKMQCSAIPKAKEAFVPFALHHATGMQLRRARHLADTMDGADALAVLEVLMMLKERARNDNRACASGSEGRA